MNITQRINRLEAWLSRIGDTLDQPIWNGQDFVYSQVTPKHVVYLKAVRAVSSLHALPLLYGHGLLIDGGAIVRCINEALSEIYFVLEEYPTITSKVEKFIAHFVAAPASSHEKEALPVPSRKIHSAEARFFEPYLNPSDAIKKIRNVYETFSGYVHSQFPHIMEIYGGPSGHWKFNTSGVLSSDKGRVYLELMTVTITSTEYAMAFMALKLGMEDLFLKILQELKGTR